MVLLSFQCIPAVKPLFTSSVTLGALKVSTIPSVRFNHIALPSVSSIDLNVLLVLLLVQLVPLGVLVVTSSFLVGSLPTIILFVVMFNHTALFASSLVDLNSSPVAEFNHTEPLLKFLLISSVGVGILPAMTYGGLLSFTHMLLSTVASAQ